MNRSPATSLMWTGSNKQSYEPSRFNNLAICHMALAFSKKAFAEVASGPTNN